MMTTIEPHDEQPRRSSTTDRGSALPLALVITVILAIVAIALASYTATALRTTAVTQARSDRLADAETATRQVLTSLSFGSNCSTLSSPGAMPNGSVADVTDCATEVTSIQTGQLQFGFVLTGELPTGVSAFERADQGNSRIEIGGDIFIGRGVEPAPENVHALDTVTVSRESCDGYVAEPIVWLGGVFPTCSNLDWQDVSPRPVGIPRPSTPGARSTISNCEVFTPGLYTDPISITTGNADTYFRPGVYEFRRPIVFGGNLTAGHGGSPLVAGSRCANAQSTDIAAPGNGGVVFIFTGQGSITLNQNFRDAYLFGRTYGARTYSIIASPVENPDLGRSALDPATQPLLFFDSNSGEFTVTGEVWAPRSFLDLEKLRTNQTRTFFGSITTARISTDVNPSFPNARLISVGAAPQQRRFRLVVTATDDRGSSTSVSTVVSVLSSGEVVPTSWRIL